MKKFLVLVVLAVIIYLIIQYNGTQQDSSDVTTADTICAGMSLSEAIDIAQLGCGEEGTLTENAFCDTDTKTWWIDIIPLEAKDGCNPACVIEVNNKATDLNRRCAGLIEE